MKKILWAFEGISLQERTMEGVMSCASVTDMQRKTERAGVATEGEKVVLDSLL